MTGAAARRQAPSLPVHRIGEAREIAALAGPLREAMERPLPAPRLLEILEAWGKAIPPALAQRAPGISFLRLWLRRGTLAAIVERELGPELLATPATPPRGPWIRTFPVGLVGHWPAANVDVQPLLSMTAGLMGGNGALVRVPTGLVPLIEPLAASLAETDAQGEVAGRIGFVSFDSDRRDCHEAMAAVVDGAMIWGGRESVTAVRGLPFPHWTRLAMFGPRISIAALDRATMADEAARRRAVDRLVRDLWLFEQQACSSPQTLFVESHDAAQLEALVGELRGAMAAMSARLAGAAGSGAMTAAVTRARAAWLLSDGERRAAFPAAPEWTLLIGDGPRLPDPVGGYTLHLLRVDALEEALAGLDGTVQTVGMGMADGDREAALAELAARRGVDRIVPLGQMHLFGSPWDGQELVAPMVRFVRHAPSA